ncbi:hypothetical protein [Mesorhizobium sp. M0051]|uniref:hypothetical protein n=1 Tax=Mesorhizobium sp. M0051 TaxID=2956862 RepID=UPI0033392FDB
MLVAWHPQVEKVPSAWPNIERRWAELRRHEMIRKLNASHAVWAAVQVICKQLCSAPRPSCRNPRRPGSRSDACHARGSSQSDVMDVALG